MAAQKVKDFISDEEMAKLDFVSDADMAKMEKPKFQRPIRPLGPIEPPAGESTIGSRAREAAIGILEPFTIQNVAGAVKDLAKAAFMGDATALAKMTKNAVVAPARPVVNYVQALNAGDYDAAANAAGGILSQTVPAVATVGEVASQGAGALRAGARGLYQKSLQPPPRTYSPTEVGRMVGTGLENNLPVSRVGLNRLEGLVNNLNQSIESDIAANPNAPIDTATVASRVGRPLRKALQQVNPEADVKAIADARNEFIRTQPATIRAEDAQAIKKGTYQQLGNKSYGEVGTASSEAQKALARGLKEELENIFPEIKGKNAAEGQLLDLRPELEAAVNRLGNRQWTMSRVVNVLTDPAVTSRIALAMNKIGKAASQDSIASQIGTALQIAQTPRNPRDFREMLAQPGR